MTIITMAPLVAFITYEAVHSLAPDTPWHRLSNIIAIVTIVTIVVMALFMFSCLSEFPVSK